ncbi:hypothetical protein CBS101457_005555 [Exobasidium rhododendri]|nr:hypothetical protein CBS101457_005555 [Exobasidium rhododendri]
MSSEGETHREDIKLFSNEKVESELANNDAKGPQERKEYDYQVEKQTEGAEKFHRLGWLQLVVVLIVEAIALGSLSIPSAFATLGMVAGVLLSVGIGLICIYTSIVVGQVKLKYPAVQHYSDVGPLMAGRYTRWGKVLKEVMGVMFVLQLVLLVGSHTLTGTIAWTTITDSSICSLVFGIVSAILLFLLAIPPSFSEMAILGYVDFVSIIAAIIITLVASGVRADKQPGGEAAVDWSAFPAPGTTFADAMIAVTNIVFAYSFAVCQFSFMEEMHTPSDYVKSVWTLGLVEIAIYTITGGVGYALIGSTVQSPALLSAGTLISRIAFGVALPVIFISGSINSVVIGRYIMDRAYANSVVKYVNTYKGWSVWLAMIGTITIIAWVIAEAIPFFNDLLSITSSLFISGFSFYFPGIMWFTLIREGGCFSSRKNIMLTLANAGCILIGFIILVAGFYASVVDIQRQYTDGTVRGSFTCAKIS